MSPCQIHYNHSKSSERFADAKDSWEEIKNQSNHTNHTNQINHTNHSSDKLWFRQGARIKDP